MCSHPICTADGDMSSRVQCVWNLYFGQSLFSPILDHLTRLSETLIVNTHHITAAVDSRSGFYLFLSTKQDLAETGLNYFESRAEGGSLHTNTHILGDILPSALPV